MANVKIEALGPGRAEIEIDGKPVAGIVMGYDFQQRGGDSLPELTLDILPGSVLITGETGVDVNPEMRGLLIALGWTPPAS